MSGFGYEDIVFQTAAAVNRVVQTRLQSENHAGFKFAAAFGAVSDEGIFMHVQAEAVSQ